MSPVGISKAVLTSGGGSTLEAEWNYEDNAAFPTYNTGTTVNLVIATGVESYRLTNNLLGQLSLSVNGSNELVLSGTLAQFGYAAVQVNEGNSYTLNASDFGVTREFVITVNGEPRTFTHRQIGNTLISKQYESYGTPNATWQGLESQQNDATQSVSASNGGCNSGTQRLSSGGVTSVSINASNGNYGDPCVGTYKRVFTYYTI
tara:strand:+ start:8572 stop:9183 length:612 start_codon:yes stop_codon:yes gene_type:complete